MSNLLRTDPGELARKFGFRPPIPIVAIVNESGFELYEGACVGNVDIQGKKITFKRSLPVVDKWWWSAVGLAVALRGGTRPQNADLMWAAKLMIPADLLSLYYVAANGDFAVLSDCFKVPHAVMALRVVVLLGAREDYSSLLVSETTAG